MKAPENITIYLRDYRPPDFQIRTVSLNFELTESICRVTNRMTIARMPSAPPHGSLTLDGENLQLESAEIDGQRLRPSDYSVDESSLVIHRPPDHFDLTVVTLIEPHKNTELQGLYRSGSMFCTQNEPEGFRRITFFLDRPDVMAIYTTRIEADQTLYPVLLANGNLVDQGVLPGGRHWVIWHDPFKKPCYLFALVAGHLARVSDQFHTRSGRTIDLHIYVDHGREPRCQHAMESLKKSMSWDEERFGLEYDLDIFMIVAVDDFNGGAMENKGLNLFNAKYVLADPKVATDQDYELIEGVIAHEYFHNWTGNRITCRDWFQLSLKEGLTVFRDQEFSADQGARAVRRIGEVVNLRNLQFAEDAGPMAHPVRPSSYMEINNFYTATVYEKGAEVIRMIHTLVGREGFRRGMDRYFALYDGQAVTTDDFVYAMESANQIDLKQFKRWYEQAGTPVLQVQAEYNTQTQTYALNLKQSCRPTPETPEKLPYHLPVALGLLGANGEDLIGTQVLELKKAEERFEFKNIHQRPVASVLRDFSAPVELRFDQSDDDLLFLMAHDSNWYNRWDASRTVITREMLKLIELGQQERPLAVAPSLIQAFARVISDEKLPPAFRARVLQFPGENIYVQLCDRAHPHSIHQAHQFLQGELARHLETQLLEIYQRPLPLAKYSVENAGIRALHNQCLNLLVASGSASHLELALAQLHTAQTMTEEGAALVAVAAQNWTGRRQALDSFYEKWSREPLVVNKWLAAQALAPLAQTLDELTRLVVHPGYDANNPNKVYALLVSFVRDNLYGFHGAQAEKAYSFVADQILALDALNPQVSSRVAAGFNHWRRFDLERQGWMESQLRRLQAHPRLSRNVYEIVTKALQPVTKL